MVIWLLVLWSFRGGRKSPLCQQRYVGGWKSVARPGDFRSLVHRGSPLGDVRLPLATRQAGVSNETSFATARDETQQSSLARRSLPHPWEFDTLAVDRAPVPGIA